ncbi:MAG: stimulus-sensing domain-containing protein [Parasphingorhabdus sp.]
MVLAIAIRNNQNLGDEKSLSLSWSARMSLTSRILAVNILAVALLAGSLFYLNNYRNRLTEERLAQASLQMSIMTDAMKFVEEDKKAELIVQFAIHLNSRIRIYSEQGTKILDSFNLARPTYQLVDPETEPWRKDAARFLDKSVEYVVFSEPINQYSEPDHDIVDNWLALKKLNSRTTSSSAIQYAQDRTPMIVSTSMLENGSEKLLLTSNARDITRIVRAERASVVLVMLIAALVSILLSLFLARTIVRPIRKLARSAVRVRMGREPKLTIPKMPERRDEIGQLARALSDMNDALRQRIDATEAFAADVTHEIKNPLASLRSALEGLGRVDDPDLQNQLINVANDDVRRIDRLINDISDASRVDAQMARSKFEPVDVGGMIEQLLMAREKREENTNVEIAYARPGKGVTKIMGDDGRLERVFSNLLDNAVSFSPANGLIEIMATPVDEEVIVHISDQGPGIPKEQRDNIFRRFHSDRPVEEEFGRHSGLGLAIAKTIVEGHEGQIKAIDRLDGQRGACFEIRLPKGY